MSILVATSKHKKVFNKTIITIGSTSDCDFVVNLGNEKLTLQYSVADENYVLVNKQENSIVLLNGVSLFGSIKIDKPIRLDIAGTSEYILLQVVQVQQDKKQDDYKKTTEKQNVGINANDDLLKDKLEEQKTRIESSRAPIIKEVGFAINDIKNRLNLNNYASTFINIGMFFSSVVVAFAVSNFISGLKIQESANIINLPMNIKILAIFSFVIFGLALVLKQSIFLYFQNKEFPKSTNESAQKLLLSISVLFLIAIYAINLMYYLSINAIFAIFMSLFFVGLTSSLAVSAGYFKSLGHMLAFELDKYEYREDFEAILNQYRSWIGKYINSLTTNRIENLKDRLFNIQIKSYGEILLGILTAPFLAYGVSNTLAMCFPEAAGWIRISGLRFSPVFLVLATFMIIFAFFSFVNAFLCVRKVQASQVIKHDGFSDYLNHGVEILGIQAIKKLDAEKRRSFAIGCAIIFIEFTMNMSYFSTEIGADLQGLLLSVIAALVPTSLLIAETYMLSQTKFDISVAEDLISKRD